MDTRIYNLIKIQVKTLNDYYANDVVAVKYEAVNQFTDTTKAEIWMPNYPNRITHSVLCYFMPAFNAANIIYDIVTKDDRVFIEICF